MSDIVKDLTNYRIKGIERAEIEYYKQLTQTLDRIEAQIVSLADQQLPRQAGKLIELQSAIAIRPKIKAILDKEYLPFADRVVRKGFGEQAKRVERQFKTIGLIPPEFQELTKGDLALVQNLKKQYYTQFKDVSNNFTRILSDKVYQNTLVGTEFTVLEKELRESINGIYATSSDPAVNRLVDYVKNNRDNPALASRVDSAVKILQSKYASTRVGENMKRYAGQILNDSLRDFDATLNFNKSKDAGLTFVKYYGDVIPTTRDICRRMVSGSLNKRANGLFTIDEINEIWASRSWSGKKGGNPMIVRGGYNCRHQFSYVNPDWYEEDDRFEEETPQISKQIQEQNKNDILNNNNTFTYDKKININEFNNALNRLDGQQQVTSKINEFINAKNISIMFIPRTIGRQVVRDKYFNDMKTMYKKNSNQDLEESIFKTIPKRMNGFTVKKDSFIATVVDSKDELDFKNVELDKLQRNIRRTLEDARDNAGRYTLKRGTERYNLEWSFSKAQDGNIANKKLQTTLHELGHQVHFWATNDSNNFAKKLAQKLTVYGETNDKEYYAELFTAYATNKKALQEFYPELTKAMDEMLDKAIKSKTKAIGIEF